MNIIHFKQLKFGLLIPLCLIITQTSIGQNVKVRKPWRVFFESGYHTASFIKNKQIGIFYKNQNPILSFLRFGVSINRFNLSLTKKSFAGYNTNFIHTYSDEILAPGEMFARYHQIIDLGFSYSLPITKSLFIEPSASFSLRPYEYESLIMYNEKITPVTCIISNQIGYTTENKLGLGFGLQIRQNLFKCIYLAFESQYQSFIYKDPINTYNEDPVWRNYQTNKSFLSYNFKLGLSLNLRRNSPSLKKEIPNSAELVPLTIRR